MNFNIMNDRTEIGIATPEQQFDLIPMPPLPMESYSSAITSTATVAAATYPIFAEEKLSRKREAARIRQQRCRARKKTKQTIVQVQVQAPQGYFAHASVTQQIPSILNAAVAGMPSLVPLVATQSNACQKETPDLTSEGKLSRKREAARIRQQRYRARKKSSEAQDGVMGDALPAPAVGTVHRQTIPVFATPSTQEGRYNPQERTPSVASDPGSIGSSSGVPSFLAMLGDADALDSHMDGDTFIDHIVADV